MTKRVSLRPEVRIRDVKGACSRSNEVVDELPAAVGAAAIIILTLSNSLGQLWDIIFLAHPAAANLLCG